MIEDKRLSVNGHLQVDDRDGNSDVIPLKDQKGLFGHLTLTPDGQWIYQLNNQEKEVQGLRADTEVLDVFTIVTSDGSSDTLSIMVQGTNDAAIIRSPKTVALNLRESHGVIGQLEINDLDEQEQRFRSVTKTLEHGVFSLDTDGGWTYRFRKNMARVLRHWKRQSALSFIVLMVRHTLAISLVFNNQAPTSDLLDVAIKREQLVTDVLLPIMEAVADPDGDSVVVETASSDFGDVEIIKNEIYLTIPRGSNTTLPSNLKVVYQVKTPLGRQPTVKVHLRASCISTRTGNPC